MARARKCINFIVEQTIQITCEKTYEMQQYGDFTEYTIWILRCFIPIINHISSESILWQAKQKIQCVKRFDFSMINQRFNSAYYLRECVIHQTLFLKKLAMQMLNLIKLSRCHNIVKQAWLWPIYAVKLIALWNGNIFLGRKLVSANVFISDCMPLTRVMWFVWFWCESQAAAMLSVNDFPIGEMENEKRFVECT